MTNTPTRTESVAVVSGSGAFTHRQIITALSGLLLAIALGSLDQTIVATAMRTIADRLHGETVQAWATTGYLISSTLAMPIYGKLSDIYGRKPLYLASIVIFVIGSLACGLAHSMVDLAAFRILQGLGGAGLMSLPTAIIADLAPVRERARYFSYLMIVSVGAGVVGPLAGGAFASADTLLGVTGWRWVFLVNVPLGVLALTTVRRALNLPHEKLDHRIDYWGSAALALGLVPLLIVVEQGRSWGWASTNAITMYAVGAVGLVLFFFVERARDVEAMLPLGIFRRGGITVCILIVFTVGFGMFGFSTVVPLYLQLVQNKPPTLAGLPLLPMLAGLIIAQRAAGKVIRDSGRFKLLAVIGLGLMSASLLGLVGTGVTTSLWVIAALGLVMGLGIGLSITVLTLAMQSAAPKRELGVANAAAGLFRQLGGTTGVAVLLSLVFSVTLGRLEHLGTGLDTDLNDTSFLQHLDPRLARPVVDAFAWSFHLTFLVAGLVLAIGFVLTWFLTELSTEKDPTST